MVRAILALCAALLLAACGVDNTSAPDAEIMRYRYVAGPPTSITLFTTVNDRNNTGAHSALLVNGSERVLFDPAGTFSHPQAPVRGDVHYGMTDRMVDFYRDYHARDTDKEKFHVIEQTILVSPEVAEMILQRVKSNGAVPKAYCANSISSLLRGVPGFDGIRTTFFPVNLEGQFAKLPGVSRRIITEENDNPGAGHGVILVDDDGNVVN